MTFSTDGCKHKIKDCYYSDSKMLVWSFSGMFRHTGKSSVSASPLPTLQEPGHPRISTTKSNLHYPRVPHG